MVSSYLGAAAAALGLSSVARAQTPPLGPFAPLPADPLSPSCMINGRGCPVPAGWQTEWGLINSTALMSADPAGFNTTRRWGMVTLGERNGFGDWG